VSNHCVLRPLRPELDAKTKTCLPAKTRFCHLDEQALYQFIIRKCVSNLLKNPVSKYHHVSLFLEQSSLFLFFKPLQAPVFS
jgi:hypothetical protein